MVEELNTEDYVTIGIYFVVVLAVGLWVSISCLYVLISRVVLCLHSIFCACIKHIH